MGEPYFNAGHLIHSVIFLGGEQMRSHSWILSAFSVVTVIISLLIIAVPALPDGIGLFQKHARAGNELFIVKSESVTYCPETALYKFEVKFADTPDYWTRDQYGRAENFFQYHIRYDESPSGYMDDDIMIWASEVEVTGDIVIRKFHGGGGPGGWGPVRGRVPYDPNNKKICFFVSADVIGDHDGEIFYFMHTGLYGRSLEQFRYGKRQKYERLYGIGIRNRSFIQCRGAKAISDAKAVREYSWGAIKSMHK